MYKANMNYADPHSGNYLFMDDGRLGLLDFGCVQVFNEEEQAIMGRLVRDNLAAHFAGQPLLTPVL